jgi:16S rRNA (cytosine1402-N4)-methyltransferase
MQPIYPEPPDIPGIPYPHLPVLYDEVLTALNPQPAGVYLDGTLGLGGHTWGILHASTPDGFVLALDQDPTAIGWVEQRLAAFAGRWRVVHRNFVHMAEVAAEQGIAEFDGILLDLGFSSFQMDDPERGLSFQADAPLDMRLDPELDTTAADLVNTLDEKSLANLIYEYGEEPFSRRIARSIVQRRPFASAKALGEAIARAIPARGKGKLHPATRTFQALRIAVNEELSVLQQTLPQALRLLKPGGKLAVIAFHSLEDRIVKEYFRDETTDCLCPPNLLICVCGHKASLDRKQTTRKPITPSEAELLRNPRARSAKLRVGVKLAT